MKLSRRSLLGAAGASLVTARVSALAGEDVIQALDAAAPEKDPTRALAALAPFRATDLAPGIALDLAAAKAGLAVDAALPGATGEARYALQMQRTAGSDLTPDGAQRRLEAETDRLTRRATALFERIGDRRGDVGARYARLWQDDRYLYSDDDVGRARALADMNGTLAQLRTGLPTFVDALPAWCLDVRALTLSPEELAAGKPTPRSLPTPGKPGYYAADLKGVRRRPSWSLPSVVAHELLPGHMIQMPLEAVARPHPLRLRYAGAFLEGWAIHAEELAGRQGAFADPRVELGHIHWLLFRSTRGLADLGIHRKGWSVTDARAKLVGWMGEPAYFALFDPDLQRIAREPGIRAAEAMAWLVIADRARPLPAPALRRFHARLLAHGRVRTEQIASISRA